jgi:AcrR family transcriptional regulator
VVGRKSGAAERRDQIVTAFCDCVVELGFDKASMGEVAERLSMDRSSMHYYFRTREELVVEATQRITRFYADRIEQAVATFVPGDRARQLIEFLFGPTFHQPRLSALMDEISVLGNRMPFFQELTAGFYGRIENLIVAVIDDSYPGVPAKKRRFTAYALTQLSEGTTVFMSLGFDRTRRQAARLAALSLLNQLETNA